MNVESPVMYVICYKLIKYWDKTQCVCMVEYASEGNWLLYCVYILHVLTTMQCTLFTTLYIGSAI